MAECFLCKKPIRFWQQRVRFNHPIFAMMPEFLYNNLVHRRCLEYTTYERISDINDEIKTINSYMRMQQHGTIRTFVKFKNGHMVLEHDEKTSPRRDLKNRIEQVISNYALWQKNKFGYEIKHPVDLRDIPDGFWKKYRIYPVDPLLEFIKFDEK